MRRFLLIAAGLALVACSRDYEAMRREHVDLFLGEGLEASRDLLADLGPLDRDTCVAIALETSLDKRTADLQARLATIDRQAVFSAFLPRISLNLGHSGTFHNIEIGEPGQWALFSDQSVTSGSISVVQPVFVPQAWFMYALFREGEEIAHLAAERARQQVALGVAAAYHRCLAQDERLVQLRADLDHVTVMLKQVLALAREGLVTPAEKAGYLALASAAKVQLAAAERERETGRAELLQAMGLHPLASIALAPSTPPDLAGDEALEDLVLTALQNRPELHIADRGIVARQHEATMALAAWLPNLIANGAITGSSDSHLRFQWNANAGATAVFTLLQGFENINAYRKARAQEAAAVVARERQITAITVEVLRAHRDLQTATEARAVAAQALRAADLGFRQVDARFREGLVTAGERLEALSLLQRVRVEETLYEHRRQLSLLTLVDVCGRSPWRTPPPKDGATHATR